MKQYTDAPITFTIDGVDMTSISQPHITFRQGETVVDVTELHIFDASNFSLVLTQAQTALFREGDVSIQLNYFDGSGQRHASEVAKVSAERNILKRVLTDD